MKLSQRILGIEPSATLAVDAKAKELQSQGKNVISFGTGEPDFVSPPAAFDYARRAMEEGRTHYPPTPGIPALRQEISSYYKRRFDLDVAPEQIVVGCGAKPMIYETLAAIVDAGDEVILLSPTWVSYIEQIRLVDGKVVVVDTEKTNFQPDLSAVEQAITPRTAAILINSPSNPTGVMYDAETLRSLGVLAVKHDLWFIWDEIYEQLVYGENRHWHPLQLMPELAERLVTINGVSKSYAMTGWRIGYALGPKEIMSKINAFQSHLTSGATSVAQWAALGAMRESEADKQKMHEAFQARRTLICGLLAAMPLVSFPEPQGAFYVFVNIKNCIGKSYKGQLLKDDIDFCAVLLEAELVAVVPGSAFLAPGYLRFSYAASEEAIREGMTRLRRFLEQIT
ncbi:MAG: pyridoxal phosphate-dependent aminotransferase [Gracilibacteraceae bacterium]|jgi:aspartate aminotransferase|nr:pyridoxal phosphate-dependent aminotransferase [Gracilibacteraceae bacterium]